MPTVHQRHRQADGQTDRQTDGRLTIAIPRFALGASRGKNQNLTIRLKKSVKYLYLIALLMQSIHMAGPGRLDPNLLSTHETLGNQTDRTAAYHFSTRRLHIFLFQIFW